MTASPILFGLETELGIARDDAPELDVVAESIALVRNVTEPGVLMRWDYSAENPHRDVRGFEVDELRQDFDEAGYVAQDAARELSWAEIKSDFVLGNGARFYNDHAHPEYCTPECASVADLVAHDRAGERIVTACARRLAEIRGATVRLYKNNTDFRGHSYGCHENYLIPRALPWEALVAAVQAFLVTRQIFAGAGKFAIEDEDRFVSAGFQLAQRSDFFTELQSVDTMQRRPLINTRDEPHADPARHRRFHVILGDANMSPFATWLKIGATALVLEAIINVERVFKPSSVLSWPRLADPLGALRAISRDARWKWEVRLAGGRAGTALEIQRAYLAAVKAHCDLASPERAQLAAAWGEVLDDLATDPRRCADRLDWVAKHELIRSFQNAEGLADDDPWLRSLDLEYHRLDPAAGLFFGLEQAGRLRCVVEDARVGRAIYEPPHDTRARIRGRCVDKFQDDVLSAQWDHITLKTTAGPLKLDLTQLFSPAELARVVAAVEQARTPDDLHELL